MDHETEVIREQMDETRADLTQKLETLENKVLGTIEDTTNTVEKTVESVKDAIEGTVETVKESVAETMETVRETFDLPEHVRNHPWLMFGGSVAAGFVAGHLFSRFMPAEGRRFFRRGHTPSLSTMASQPPEPPSYSPNGGRYEQPVSRPEPAYTPQAREEARPGIFGSLTNMFGAELNKLKGLAIGTALGLVRDTIKQAGTPEIGDKLAEMIDGITTKLGGEVLKGPLFEKSEHASACPPPQSRTEGTSTLRSATPY